MVSGGPAKRHRGTDPRTFPQRPSAAGTTGVQHVFAKDYQNLKVENRVVPVGTWWHPAKLDTRFQSHQKRTEDQKEMKRVVLLPLRPIGKHLSPRRAL